MTILFTRIKNLNLHFKIIGHGEPVILLHGWGRDMEYFTELARYLAQRFSVYLLDLPGFGLSVAPAEIWGSLEYAILIKHFIIKFGLIKPILIGHSFGGKIAIHLAIFDDIAIRKLILISSSGIKLSKSLRVKLKVGFLKMAKCMTKLPLVGSIFMFNLEIYRRKFGSNDYNYANGIMRSILIKTVQENIVGILSLIKQPVLLVWGKQDFVTPIAAGYIMQQCISGSQLKIITDSGHFPFIDSWQEFIKEVDIFLG
ncbi:MAG: alpha/beta hydrolase [Coxiellaceae bacterium]|nr:alpha/beta hydrolase [Coxiellaceae bacterium]